MQTAQRFALNARLEKSNTVKVKPDYIVNCAQCVKFGVPGIQNTVVG